MCWKSAMTVIRRFGGERVIHQDVLHLRAGVSGATINGDISAAGTLPAARFDCIIFTQTLHLVFDMRAAIDQLHAALRPGGVLLLTTPGISPIDRGEWADSWFWSLSSAALARLLALRFDMASTEMETFGNVFAATAFLQGICCEEVDVGRLLPRDKAYPVVITARAERR
jgi:SAM-dependent methyltransferase